MHPLTMFGCWIDWGTGLAWWHNLANAIIAGACCTCTAVLVRLSIEHPRVGRIWLVRGTAAFVSVCGVTHLLALTTVLPQVWTGLAGHFCVALASVAGAVAAWPAVLRLADAPSAARLLAINEQLNRLQASTAEADADKTIARETLASAQRMETLGQLAGGVAHDINNVLQTISAASGLLEKRSGDPAEVTRLNRLIGRTTDRASAVVNRLLAFARRSELRSAHLDVSALLSSLTEVLNHTLGGAVSVVLRVDPLLPALWADAGQLETVLVNLATNARDAMPFGGTITLSAAAERFDAGTPHRAGLAPGNYVRLSVADEGVGMDEATLAHAVEPFYTTKPRGKGTGLGLSMASGFAAQSGGLLNLRSTPGVGTCVTIWLPQNPAGAQTRAGPAPAHARLPILPQTFVLLVDDETIMRELMAEELAERGFAVLQASSAQAALHVLMAGETVDLLVTDLSMPGMDGVALIEAAQLHRKDLPAILLTGHAHDNARLSAHGNGDRGYTLLTKPIRANELAAHVVRLLGTAPSMPLREPVEAAG